MDYWKIFSNFFGGLGLFLTGMRMMSEGMQKIAGSKLRKILSFLTANRFSSLLVGLVITLIVQSSSATTVMTVGFVNAGLIMLPKAISIILGANIGTTITGWIISFKATSFIALPLIGLSVLIHFSGKEKKRHYLAEVFFGFGILFLGMLMMKDGLNPLRNHPGFMSFVGSASSSLSTLTILKGIFIGAVTTIIVQSSSAVIGITIALATQGIILFPSAVALVIGENIGTTITAQLASIGTSKTARQTALAHSLFNVFGAFIVFLFFNHYVKFVDWIIPGIPDGLESIGVHIAMAHTLFNVINVMIFLPFVNQFSDFCEKVYSSDVKVNEESIPCFYNNPDESLHMIPSLGIFESERELIQMSGRVKESFELLITYPENDAQKIISFHEKILVTEEIIDKYQLHINEFLLLISSSALSIEESSAIGNYISYAHSIEKTGDYIERISRVYEKLSRKELSFSNEASEKLKTLFLTGFELYKMAIDQFDRDEKNPLFYEEFQVLRRKFMLLIKDEKISHFSRLRGKICDFKSALYYVDILNHLDAMQSQIENLAEVSAGNRRERKLINL